MSTSPSIVVMGVQGSGKSTIGRSLADSLGLRFIDGDDLHTAEARAQMSAGRALTDEDRLPWLTRVAETIAAAERRGEPVVVACSALKRSYRDLMRGIVPNLWFAQLEGNPALLAERLSGRRHDFMPPALLDSQLATLEPLAADEAGMRVDLAGSPDDIVASIGREVGRR